MADTLVSREGRKVPDVAFRVRRNGEWATVSTDDIFAKKNVVVFSLPGAFTPTCSQKHLPGYVQELAQLKAKGIDMVACLSVNDAFVMKAWAEQHEALGKITMLADGSAAFTKALGIELDLTKASMGVRANRGVFVIEDGVVKSVDMEAPGKFDVSGAEACMRKL